MRSIVVPLCIVVPLGLVSCGMLGCGSPVRPTERARAAAPVRSALALPEIARRPVVRGGSLAVTRNGRIVWSDPDRDGIVIAQLAADFELVGFLALTRGDAPGRIAIDEGGLAHVALRDGGAIVTFDPESARLLRRTNTCPHPVGLTWDHPGHRLLWTCEGGEVFAAREGRVRAIADLQPGLRDVVVDSRGRAFATSFRTARVYDLETGRAKRIPPTRRPRLGQTGWQSERYLSRVAWRAATDGEGGVWIAHQHHMESEIRPPFFRYYAGSGPDGTITPVVAAALTHVVNGRPNPEPIRIPETVMPVDVAVSEQGDIAIADGAQPTVLVIDRHEGRRIYELPAESRGVSVAWLGQRLLVQLRGPAGIAAFELDSEIATRAFLGLDDDVGDEAPAGAVAYWAGRDSHEVFHRATSRRIACASCHPEGGDDGHVWNFAGEHRRTPSLAGGIMATLPFHWNGEHTQLGDLMDAVFRVRMGGSGINEARVGWLGTWLDTIEARRAPPSNPEGSPARGEAIFRRTEVGCASCHCGPHYTDNANHDVGTGGYFQTPPLTGLRLRPPYFHDGRVRDLRARFGSGHTEGHGSIEGLSARDIRDVIAFLETL